MTLNHKESFFINDNRANFLTDSLLSSIEFEQAISEPAQIRRINSKYVQAFLEPEEFHKIIINTVDQFNFKNNGGFNLKNFQLELIEKDMTRQKIINDWSFSFTGNFVSFLSRNVDCDTNVQYSFAKFDGKTMVDFNDPRNF